MNRKVNVWEIAEILQAYQNLKTLKDWNSSLSSLTEFLKTKKFEKGLSITKLLKQLVAAIRIELICARGVESLTEGGASIDLVPFRLQSLQTNLSQSVPFLNELQWPEKIVDKLFDYVYELPKSTTRSILQTSQASTSASTSSTSSNGNNKRKQSSGTLWAEFDIETNLDELRLDTPGAATDSIAQNVILKTSEHTHTLSASDGDGPFTVLLKIYDTKGILGDCKDNWWKAQLTSMQFTMGADDAEYETLAELTTQVTQRLKKDDNFKATKKRKFW